MIQERNIQKNSSARQFIWTLLSGWVHIFTDNPKKPAALTVFSSGSVRVACVGNNQLTRTGFVRERWTKAAGLIINTSDSGQTKMRHKGRELITEATSHSTRCCSLLCTADPDTHSLVSNCRSSSLVLSRTNILYASGSHHGGWDPSNGSRDELEGSPDD